MAEPRAPFAIDLEKYYRLHLCSSAPALVPRIGLWASHFGLHCVAVYRFGRAARRLRARRPLLGWVPLQIARVLDFAMGLIHHVQIHAEVGPGFYIGHAATIFVGPTRIGANCSLTHNVTIGVGHSEGATGIPTVGDDVWIGTGSVISGAIHVADGVTIASGTMLSRSVPPRCLVGGNPGRPLVKSYDNAPLLGGRRHERNILKERAAEERPPEESAV
jgi:serine O-acetyltransferase